KFLTPPNAIRYRMTNARYGPALTAAINNLKPKLEKLNVFVSGDQFVADGPPIGVGLIPPSSFENISFTGGNGITRTRTKHIIEPEKWIGGNLLFIVGADQSVGYYTNLWSDYHWLYDGTTTPNPTITEHGASHVEVMENQV